MPLPHRINITSGGTGADSGEMFFGCQVDRINGPPGLGSRGFSPGENALSKNFNRSAFALAENDEYLGDIVVKRELACVEVGALTAFTGNQVDIDPSGAALGDINYSGSLYMGDVGWANNQENRDTLFQVLDSNYNEVIVDGVEVKVASFVGGAVGDGFELTLVSLILNKTLPSGNYRVAYGRGRTIETIPAYALIRADVRGLHEAPGESGYRGMYVLDATGSAPCDFSGATALQDALAALGSNKTLYLRNGTYTGPVGAGITLPAGTTIIGESKAAVIRIANGYDLEIPNGDCHLYSLVVDQSGIGSATSKVDVRNNGNCSFFECDVDNMYFYVYNCDHISIENARCGGYDCAINVYLANNVSFKNVEMAKGSNPGATGVLVLDEGSFDILFDNVTCDDTGDQTVFYIDSSSNIARVSLKNCVFLSGDATCVNILAIMLRDIEVENCRFSSEARVMDSGSLPRNFRMIFRNCTFSNTATAVYYGFSTVRMVVDRDPNMYGVIMENCEFSDVFNRGNIAVPIDNGYPIFELEGIHFTNLHVEHGATSASVWYQDTTHLSLTHCKVDHLQFVLKGTSNGMPAFPGLGAVELYGYSVVSDFRIHVEDIAAAQDWWQPVVYADGGSIKGQIVIDGVFLHSAATPMQFGVGASKFFHLFKNVKLTRVFIDNDNEIITLDKFIVMDGAACSVERSYLDFVADCDIEVVIYIDNGSYNKILNNIVKISDATAATGTDTYHIVDLKTGSDQSHAEIAFNEFYWGDAVTDGSRRPIEFVSGGAKYGRIHSNVVVVPNLVVGANNDVLISIAANDLGGGAGAQCGACLASNNVLINEDSSSGTIVPAILYVGGAPTAVDTNIYAYE